MQVPAALARARARAARPTSPRRARSATRRAPSGARLLTEHEAKALLAAFGLPVPRSIVAHDRDAAVAAAREIGFPVVIKLHSPDITHKSDVGGVRLNLQNEEMVASAFDDMLRHVRALRPQARIEGVVVEPMLRYAHAARGAGRRRHRRGVRPGDQFRRGRRLGRGGARYRGRAAAAQRHARARADGAHPRAPPARGLSRRARGRPRGARCAAPRRVAHGLRAALAEGNGSQPGARASRRRGHRRRARGDRSGAAAARGPPLPAHGDPPLPGRAGGARSRSPTGAG